MSSQPIFVQKPVMGGATLSAANTAMDGSGSIGTTIFQLLSFDGSSGAGSNGGYLDYIRVKTLSTAGTDSIVRFFIADTGGIGAGHSHLLGEILVPAWTVGQTIPQADLTWYPPVNMGEIPQGWVLYATVSQSVSVHALAVGGLN